MALAASDWITSAASWGYNMGTPAQTIEGILERGHEKRQGEKQRGCGDLDLEFHDVLLKAVVFLRAGPGVEVGASKVGGLSQ